MASVSETLAAIDRSNVKVAEAMTAAQTAAGLFAEAHTALTAVAGAHSAEIGVTVVDQARELCEQAFTLGHVAIEQANVYGGSL